MDRRRKVEAILSTRVVMSKGEYIQALVAEIVDQNATMQNAMENDKFHVMGACSAFIDNAVKDLQIALDV